MKTYTFVIGTSDDFESLDNLIDYYDQYDIGGDRNYQAIEFEAPDGADEETITMIGRGLAFSSDWCMDDTYSFLHVGRIDRLTSELQFVQQGEKAIGAEVGVDPDGANAHICNLLDMIVDDKAATEDYNFVVQQLIEMMAVIRLSAKTCNLTRAVV